jgi:hypothetical protein
MQGTRLGRALGIAIATAFAFAPVAAKALAIGEPGGPAKLAYLDPGTGSFVLQALVAALAGVAVVVNAYWSKIKRLLGIGAVERDDREPDDRPRDD